MLLARPARPGSTMAMVAGPFHRIFGPAPRCITPVEDLLASVVGVLLCLMLSQQGPSESGIDVGLADGCSSLLLELEFVHHLITWCEMGEHEILIHEVAWQSWDIAKCPLGG